MKLATGNSNLMKAKAEKVNKTVGLGAFAQTLGEKNAPRYVRGGPVLLQKHPDAVKPQSTNVWGQPVYVSERPIPTRPGADDHMKFKSLGDRT